MQVAHSARMPSGIRDTAATERAECLERMLSEIHEIAALVLPGVKMHLATPVPVMEPPGVKMHLGTYALIEEQLGAKMPSGTGDLMMVQRAEQMRSEICTAIDCGG